MELKAPEMIIGGVIVYLLMQPKAAEEPAVEEEPAAVEEEEEAPTVARRPIPPGFIRGLGLDPLGPPSVPSITAALRRKLARITDP